MPKPNDPYEQPTPYDVLGVPTEATAAQIRDRFNELQREVQEKGGQANECARRIKVLEEAYNQLRVAGQRVLVDFRLLDPRIGLKQCEKIASTFAAPKSDLKGLVKPRTIRVTHAALLGDLSGSSEPEPVLGLHPRPLAIAQQAELPALLAIEYDC